MKRYLKMFFSFPALLLYDIVEMMKKLLKQEEKIKNG